MATSARRAPRNLPPTSPPCPRTARCRADSAAPARRLPPRPAAGSLVHSRSDDQADGSANAPRGARSLFGARRHGMVQQDQGIATQREFDEKHLRRAAIRTAITIESRLTPQAMRINPAAVADAAQKTGWQLVEPGLPDPCPGPIRIPSEEFLSAAAGAI